MVKVFAGSSVRPSVGGFDDERADSNAGFVLVATLAERLGIEDLARGLVLLAQGSAGGRERRAEGDGADVRDAARC